MAHTNMDKEQIKFLIEIVGCEDLPSADCMGESDPYVEVQFNGITLHKTNHTKSLNPVYTLRKNSFFIWKVAIDELSLLDENDNESGGLKLTVYDYDKVWGHDLLGVANVPPKDLYEAKEERLTYALERTRPPHENCGTISIRCRRATEYDEAFMETFHNNEEKGELTGVLMEDVKEKKQDGDSISVGPIKGIVQRINGIISQKKRIIPLDFDDLNGLGSMTEEDLVLQPSHQYVSIGSGSIAKVYLEM